MDRVEIYIHIDVQFIDLRSYSWLGLMNVYKFLLDNFHLQDPSTIYIGSNEMPPAKSRFLSIKISLHYQSVCDHSRIFC
jgi:hypothetical protein